ncbi:MAG TPA: AAA family ATPase, partial [Pyrinomonadaceae bacterium]|nr:AAA family ATPase [Pyrinomonadaceae bacterium]
MIRFVDFENFKGLRDARLPLSRFTLIVGANGSGKSSAMQAISMVNTPDQSKFMEVANADLQRANSGIVTVTIN